MKNLFRLASLYAAVAQACWAQPPLNLLWGGLLKAPQRVPVTTGAKQFAGLTALGSGTAYVTMSTAMVTSGSLINATLMVNTTVASGSGGSATAVSSIVDGVSFAFGYTDGVGRGPGGTVMWEIRRTK